MATLRSRRPCRHSEVQRLRVLVLVLPYSCVGKNESRDFASRWFPFRSTSLISLYSTKGPAMSLVYQPRFISIRTNQSLYLGYLCLGQPAREYHQLPMCRIESSDALAFGNMLPRPRFPVINMLTVLFLAAAWTDLESSRYSPRAP